MTAIVIEDWAKIEAVKRAYPGIYKNPDEITNDWDGFTIALHMLAEMIQKYEKPPVSRELLCARKAVVNTYCHSSDKRNILQGRLDGTAIIVAALEAIELFKNDYNGEPE